MDFLKLEVKKYTSSRNKIGPFQVDITSLNRKSTPLRREGVQDSSNGSDTGISCRMAHTQISTVNCVSWVRQYSSQANSPHILEKLPFSAVQDLERWQRHLEDIKIKPRGIQLLVFKKSIQLTEGNCMKIISRLLKLN